MLIWCRLHCLQISLRSNVLWNHMHVVDKIGKILTLDQALLLCMWRTRSDCARLYQLFFIPIIHRSLGCFSVKFQRMEWNYMIICLSSVIASFFFFFFVLFVYCDIEYCFITELLLSACFTFTFLWQTLPYLIFHVFLSIIVCQRHQSLSQFQERVHFSTIHSHSLDTNNFL